MHPRKTRRDVVSTVTTVSETNGVARPAVAETARLGLHPVLAAGPPAVDIERLRQLQGLLLQFVAQCEAKAVWNVVAPAASCSLGVGVGLLARSLVGGWFFGGVDIPVLLSPAGVFFQVSRKSEENARHYQALMAAIQTAIDGGAAPMPATPGAAGRSLASTLPPIPFNAAHASPRQRVVRTEVLNLLNQIQAPGPEPGPVLHPPPQRLEFLGQVEPRRFLVRADGIDVALTQTQYRLLLAMAIRRRLFGSAQPRGDDPGSYYRIGTRRDHPNDLEARFHEQAGRQILDEDGRGTKLRRCACASDAIEIDPSLHLADLAITEDPEVAGLLRQLASSSCTDVASP